MSSSTKISLPLIVALTVGGMIGSAIFSLSGQTVALAGSGALISWAAAGALFLGFALICVKLSSLYPRSGGTYVWPALAFNSPKLGRFSAAVYIFGCIGGAVFSCIFIGEYLQMWTGLPIWSAPIFAAVSVLLIARLDSLGLKIATVVNLVITCLLLACLIWFAWFTVSGAPESPVGAPPGFDGMLNPLLFDGVFTQIPIAMVAFGAIVTPAFMVESLSDDEQKRSKLARKAVWISFAIVITIYLLVVLGITLNVPLLTFYENEQYLYMPFTPALAAVGAPVLIANLIQYGALPALFTTAFVTIKLATTTLHAASPHVMVDSATPLRSAQNDGDGSANVYRPTRHPAGPKGIAGSIPASIFVLSVIGSLWPLAQTLVINFGAACNALSVLLISAVVLKSVKQTPYRAVAIFIGLAIFVCYAVSLLDTIESLL